MDDKNNEIRIERARSDSEKGVTTDVALLDGKTTYLVPTPSADPNGQ